MDSRTLEKDLKKLKECDHVYNMSRENKNWKIWTKNSTKNEIRILITYMKVYGLPREGW